MLLHKKISHGWVAEEFVGSIFHSKIAQFDSLFFSLYLYRSFLSEYRSEIEINSESIIFEIFQQ